MAYRKTVKPKIDKKIFTNTAKKTKKINVNPKPSRGGIRLREQDRITKKNPA